ncbi:hypothetical protein HQ544_01725 [Candidatus Falkowbacteria bacterium]|nr:hypothetical protein [Candidatus Falkowbacteria bacterium]
MDAKEKKFLYAKEKAEKFYGSIEKIFCPYFREYVKFNVKGFDHLKMKGWNKARSKEDQYTRFRLIELAPTVIKKSGTLQGYSETKEFERKKINNRWDNILTEVFYYEFIAILNDLRVRVIVKQLLGGQKYFWSIMPFWKVKKSQNKRLLHYGKPAED